MDNDVLSLQGGFWARAGEELSRNEVLFYISIPPYKAKICLHISTHYTVL